MHEQTLTKNNEWILTKDNEWINEHLPKIMNEWTNEH